ncbi:MAG: alanine--glyoxylate aminotransferase family protein [Pseudomonadales bacterium]|jgi:aspartate aminotransferase-like enzyme|nr:alanine--glyoxylate aminotransferase family protein [Pseudomonadales bacterium]
MPALRPDVDPDGLLEYSVVFTDRSLNHMSKAFQGVMHDIDRTLREVYRADGVAIVPGGGTFGMEAVARQFTADGHALVVRNGWFSYRWTQILEAAGLAPGHTVLRARRTAEDPRAPFAPVPAEEVAERIRTERPAVVFAPHVETSAGILLPDDYVRTVAAATREVDGLFVLDCIASGALWVDMRVLGVDVLISAPQKGWSASPCSGLVLLGERAEARLATTRSNSFACDLGKWREIMRAYENGGHAYHATMPTDALRRFRDAMLETREDGFDAVRAAQVELGSRVRGMLKERGFTSVAAEGFEAPGVVVSYTEDPDLKNGSRLLAHGLQIAAGVPLMCDEGEDFSTFRIGLFGLDKLHDVDGAVARLAQRLDAALG